MAQLEPGTRLGGRYRIATPLGAGGMGVVYRARDEKLGRQVAVKTLVAERVGDDKARARLVREARAAAALEHPGIAQIFDVGETEDGGAFLVMELVRGKSLRALMSSKALEPEAILRVITEVADALDHAHEQGVIHRDIKPDNVMVREDGRACLLDFGLAKEITPAMAETVDSDTPDEAEHLTKEGALIGTLSYLAPEQARGIDVGPRSDQFALATTAYEALAGRLPWDGKNAAAVLAQILVDDAPAPSSLESALPLRTDHVFARALAKDPAERFEDARSFARALTESFDDEVPMAAAPPSPPAWVSWAALVAVAVATALALSVLWPDEVEPETPAPTLAALASDAVIGCPILDASGVTEPSGWFGAMAADLACQRLTEHLGGDVARTRTPPELLELEPIADDDFPRDPYVEDDARERSMEVARALDAFVTGSVRRGGDGRFEVTLSLETPDGTLATADGSGDAVHLAVAEALDGLVASDAIAGQENLDEDVARWFGASSVEIALGFDDLSHASLTGVGVDEACEALIARASELGPIRAEVRRVCLRHGVEAASSLTRPPLDRSGPAGLALTAHEHADELPEEELRALAAELAEARREESSALGQATLAKGEILIAEQLGERDRSRDLLIMAARLRPRDWFFRVHLVRAMLRTRGAHAATRALGAWAPHSPEAWRTVALPIHDPEVSAVFLRRAYESGGTLPLHGIFLGNALLRIGRREEVRAIAARYATAGPRTRLAGELLRARVEISEGRFGRAFERLSEALQGVERFGNFTDGDTEALLWMLDLSEVLERREEAADPVARRLVLADPPRLVTDQPHYELLAMSLCMHASAEVGAACLARLRGLRESHDVRAARLGGASALLDGAERYVVEDWPGAVEAWRPIVGSRAPFLRVDAFERAGEPELVARIERRNMRRETFAGARLAHVRGARRAAAAGETERARELAERVVEAWSTADVAVPGVAEMRALLAELPGS